MTVAFELDGQAFTALNGGPMFKFNEAISFQVNCETQEEVDYYWEKLSEGGDKKAQQCGWLKDKYGVSWQVVPSVLPEMISDPDAEKSQRAMKAMLQMKKIDIDKLKRAVGENGTCVRNCCLDGDDICMGCFRSLSEILQWSAASDKDRTEIINRCGHRRVKALLKGSR